MLEDERYLTTPRRIVTIANLRHAFEEMLRLDGMNEVLNMAYEGLQNSHRRLLLVKKAAQGLQQPMG